MSKAWWAALCRFPLGVLGFRLLYVFGLDANLIAQLMNLRVERSALLIHLIKLAGEDNAQFGAHLVAQLTIALGLAGLAFERVHLARDFLENVVDAVQICFCIFEARFGEPLLGFEARNAGGFFDDGAAISRTAAENLADASLLDERVRLGPKAGAHEEFLNAAQAAEFSVEQVFAIAAAEEAPRHGNFSGVILLLIKFAAANF